jgi:hypothetical protein
MKARSPLQPPLLFRVLCVQIVCRSKYQHPGATRTAARIKKFDQNRNRHCSFMVDAFERPKEPKLPKTAEEKTSSRRVIVVLTKAALETVKTKRGFELLNADEHKGILTKHKKDPSEYRPDIVHQVFLSSNSACFYTHASNYLTNLSISGTADSAGFAAEQGRLAASVCGNQQCTPF